MAVLLAQKCRNLSGTISLLAMAMVSMPAFAQDAPSKDTDPNTVEEIIVTAQRRQQKIEEVPISITAFTADDLQKDNIRGIEDYFAKTANVNFGEGIRGRQSVDIGIRGVSNISDQSNAFTIYIDEFAGLATNPNIYDVERVEVLRGPQGTYFGRNSTGGAINITTNKPKDKLAGQLELGYGSFRTFSARGFVNVPVTDTLFVRLTGDFDRSDGFVKNLNPNGSQPDIRNYSGRFQARYVPTDKLTIDIHGSIERNKIGLLQSVPTGVLDENAGAAIDIIQLANLRISGIPDFGIAGNPALVTLPASFLALTGDPVDHGSGFYPTNRNRLNVGSPEKYVDRRATFIGKIAYDFDFATLSAITGYQKVESEQQRDSDGIALDLGRDLATTKQTIFTQELRLNSIPNDKFNWTAGIFYSDSKANGTQKIAVGPAIAAALGADTFLDVVSLVNSESFAAFAEINVSPVERFTATLGLRYTRDKVGVGGSFASLEGFPDLSDPDTIVDFIANGLTLGAPASNISPVVKFNDVSPRFALSYNFDNGVNAYASVSNGYKAGGNQTNPQAVAAGIAKFKPEDIWNYEIGLKGRVFDNTLQFGLAVFYSDWKDLQVATEVINLGSSFVLTGNAASARNYGVELDFNWATPLKGLLFNGSVGYLNARFKNYRNAVLGNFNDICRQTVGQAPVVGGAPDCDLSGQRLPLASKWTVSLGADYTFGLTDGIDAFVGGDMSYRSATTPSLTLLALGGANGIYPFATPPRTIFNLRAGVDAGKWRIDAYAQNLFNKLYFTGASSGGALDGYRVVPSPRVIGVRAAINF